MNDYSSDIGTTPPPSTKDEASNLLGSRAKLAEELFSRKERKGRKETIDGRFAAEASENPLSQFTTTDPLDRGCLSRRRNIKPQRTQRN